MGIAKMMLSVAPKRSFLPTGSYKALQGSYNRFPNISLVNMSYYMVIDFDAYMLDLEAILRHFVAVLKYKGNRTRICLQVNELQIKNTMGYG